MNDDTAETVRIKSIRNVNALNYNSTGSAKTAALKSEVLPVKSIASSQPDMVNCTVTIYLFRPPEPLHPICLRPERREIL